jgi:hypothetical protein
MEFCQDGTGMENELSPVVNAVPALMWTALPSRRGIPELCKERVASRDSEPDRKLDRRVVDRGHDSTNHKLIHRNRKGEKQCHTLQSEKKIQATSTFTTKTMARANRSFSSTDTL